MNKYHTIMESAFADRRGHAPLFANEMSSGDHCEQEHDWTLLIIARSERMQAAARQAVGILASHERAAGSTGRAYWLIARVLCGDLQIDASNRGEIGYITMERAMEVLAIAATGNDAEHC